MNRVTVIDSHTGGEPTRVVLDGMPDLGGGPLAERLEVFRARHDHFRSAVVNEPRGSDAMVGALLLEPADRSCAAGVIFFNNIGVLGMCGHGTMGLLRTLAHLGRLAPGSHRIETPVGVVVAILHEDGRVSVENVPSRRKACAVRLALPEGREVSGDVAWGGNWFFLCADHGFPLESSAVDRLSAFAGLVRSAVNGQGFPEVDHVELFGPPTGPGASSRNFVLCPGGAYDRSPCGTGTSAKLACLAADGVLAEGESWVQEGILGSCFTGRYRWRDREGGWIIPTIAGEAFITAEATLLIDERDPFRFGIRNS